MYKKPHLGVKYVPVEISQLVQDFSGGSYFWVREILQFIKEYGHESFMSAIGEEPVPRNDLVEPTNLSRLLGIKPSSTMPMSGFGASSRPESRRSSFDNEKGYTGRLSPLPSSSYIGAHAPVRTTGSARNSLNFTPTHDPKVPISATHKQLDHLLLIRFGNLQQDEQRVLRKASVIGVNFTTSVLFSILRPHLQEHFSEYLQALVSQKWVSQDLTSEHTYHFVHGHVRQLVYELTPPSERNQLHLHVVDHLLQAYPDDKTQYFSIWYHYKQCDTELALEYAIKATTVMLESEDMHDYIDCLEVLTSSFVCCHSYYDTLILQQVAEKLQERVENLFLQPESKKRGWFMRILLHRNSPSNSHKISPRAGSSSDETDDDNKHKTSEKYVFPRKSFFSIATDSSKSAGEIENANTRQQLLEKVKEFRTLLRNKMFGLSAELVGQDPSLNQPREWQRKFLELLPNTQDRK